MTSDGGLQLRWQRDGRELVYLGLDGRLMSVAVTPSSDGRSSTATPVAMFPTRVLMIEPSVDINGQSYDMTADGKRFLMPTGGEPARTVPITLALNWKPPLT